MAALGGVCGNSMSLYPAELLAPSSLHAPIPMNFPACHWQSYGAAPSTPLTTASITRAPFGTSIWKQLMSVVNHLCFHGSCASVCQGHTARRKTQIAWLPSLYDEQKTQFISQGYGNDLYITAHGKAAVNIFNFYMIDISESSSVTVNQLQKKPLLFKSSHLAPWGIRILLLKARCFTMQKIF